jgi:hypothetical protein
VTLDHQARTPRNVPEKETLQAFLDRYRAVLLHKFEGLDDEQLRRRLVPSATTPLGLLKHMADVERSWFREVFAAEELPPLWPEGAVPGAGFRLSPGDGYDSVCAVYRDEIEHANAIIAAASLDDVSRGRRTGVSLRWIVVHMIEETARHVGHADILREQIDGTLGD